MTPKISEILKEMERISKENPGYRFGQIIANATRGLSCDPFYISDSELLEVLRET